MRTTTNGPVNLHNFEYPSTRRKDDQCQVTGDGPSRLTAAEIVGVASGEPVLTIRGQASDLRSTSGWGAVSTGPAGGHTRPGAGCTGWPRSGRHTGQAAPGVTAPRRRNHATSKKALRRIQVEFVSPSASRMRPTTDSVTVSSDLRSSPCQ